MCEKEFFKCQGLKEWRMASYVVKNEIHAGEFSSKKAWKIKQGKRRSKMITVGLLPMLQQEGT